MKFFNKIKFKIAFNKTGPIGYALLCFLPLIAILFIISIDNGEPEFNLLLYAGVFIAAFIVMLLLRMNNNEYKELIRQAELIGNLEDVGNAIKALKVIPTKRGTLKASERLIFYTDSLVTKIIVPSKITSISAGLYFYKCTHYTVSVTYLYENHISVEMRSMKDAEDLAFMLKRTVAPHLLTESRHDSED